MGRAFRIWNCKNKCWVSDVIEGEKFLFMLQKNTFGNYTILATVKGDYIRNEYIGIKDKKDVCIFEDDIVKLKVFNNSGEIEECVVGVIKYVPPSYVLLTEKGFFSLSACDDMEVIGDIRSKTYHGSKRNENCLDSFLSNVFV
ncbi:YopX family protein (plasmid) [Paenibacillus thiaminolyticus]|uniref:YopX family protein n=1 Tax=Paenibacillus thiaminolyticus TaxID=49283 RepID=UPI00232BC9B5|nr:YopX family protein [Paenibacillus thiaminolyticus]WCF11594.1 YopX family protein [Paenibacillus thiaminolyticus]